MKKLLRFALDVIIFLDSLVILYYIPQLLKMIYNSLILGINNYSIDEAIQLFIILSIVFGIHVLLTVWMYMDIAKRKFTSNNQRAFWLGMLGLGLAPIYYFYFARKSLG